MFAQRLLTAVAFLACANAAAEVSAEIDGPFRTLFPDVNLLNIERKERTNWVGVITSLGGTTVTYELTVSDSMNKKFKVSYSQWGDLTHADKHRTTIARLPQFMQQAVAEKQGAVDGATELEVRAYSGSAETATFRISGKAGGKKFEVEVQNTKRKIHPTANILVLHRKVSVFNEGDKATQFNTIDLDAMTSTPYRAKFTYAWKQVSGEDLKIPEADLVKRNLKIAARRPGKYGFQLTVNDGEESSESRVDIEVTDGEK